MLSPGWAYIPSTWRTPPSWHSQYWSGVEFRVEGREEDPTGDLEWRRQPVGPPGRLVCWLQRLHLVDLLWPQADTSGLSFQALSHAAQSCLLFCIKEAMWGSEARGQEWGKHSGCVDCLPFPQNRLCFHDVSLGSKFRNRDREAMFRQPARTEAAPG